MDSDEDNDDDDAAWEEKLISPKAKARQSDLSSKLKTKANLDVIREWNLELRKSQRSLKEMQMVPGLELVKDLKKRKTSRAQEARRWEKQRFMHQ